MKTRKLFIISSVLATAVVAAVCFTACKKDNKITDAKLVPTETKNNDSNWKKDDKAVLAHIKDFKEKVKTKNNSPVTAEEALWDIEAALNYTYCMGIPALINMTTDTTYLQFTLNSNNLISFEQVADLYLQTATRVEAIQAKIKPTNGLTKIIDVENITVAGSNEIKFRVMVAYGYMYEEKDACDFSTTDNWWWGQGRGKIPGPTNNDAAVVIAYKFNSCKYPIGNNYFTDIVSYTIYQYQIPSTTYRTPNDALDNNRDYLIFYKTSPSPIFPYNDFKLFNYPNLDMNWYLNSLNDVKNIVRANQFPTTLFPNIDFAYCTIEGKGDDWDFKKCNVIWHEPTFKFGIKHLGSNQN